VVPTPVPGRSGSTSHLEIQLDIINKFSHCITTYYELPPYLILNAEQIALSTFINS